MTVLLSHEGERNLAGKGIFDQRIKIAHTSQHTKTELLAVNLTQTHIWTDTQADAQGATDTQAL